MMGVLDIVGFPLVTHGLRPWAEFLQSIQIVRVILMTVGDKNPTHATRIDPKALQGALDASNTGIDEITGIDEDAIGSSVGVYCGRHHLSDDDFITWR